MGVASSVVGGLAVVAAAIGMWVLRSDRRFSNGVENMAAWFLIASLFGGFIAVVFGATAWRLTKDTGKKLGIAGVVTGGAALALDLVFIVDFLREPPL